MLYLYRNVYDFIQYISPKAEISKNKIVHIAIGRESGERTPDIVDMGVLCVHMTTQSILLEFGCVARSQCSCSFVARHCTVCTHSVCAVCTWCTSLCSKLFKVRPAILSNLHCSLPTSISTHTHTHLHGSSPHVFAAFIIVQIFKFHLENIYIYEHAINRSGANTNREEMRWG